MTPHRETLQRAIKCQGTKLREHTEWLKKAINRAMNSIENSQRQIDIWHADLKTTLIQIQTLTEEYHGLLGKEQANGKEESGPEHNRVRRDALGPKSGDRQAVADTPPQPGAN